MWFVKQVGNAWVTRCPYCKSFRVWTEKPPDTWVCKCKAIVNETTYKRLNSLAQRLRGRK